MAEANALTDRQREYREVYLRSDHWQGVRKAALARAGNRCAVCNSPEGLDVHHRTYAHVGCEDETDVTVLCRDCHKVFHRSGKLAPEPLSPDAFNPRLHELPPKGALEVERFLVRRPVDDVGEAA